MNLLWPKIIYDYDWVIRTKSSPVQRWVQSDDKTLIVLLSISGIAFDDNLSSYSSSNNASNNLSQSSSCHSEASLLHHQHPHTPFIVLPFFFPWERDKRKHHKGQPPKIGKLSHNHSHYSHTHPHHSLRASIPCTLPLYLCRPSLCTGTRTITIREDFQALSQEHK